MLYKYYLIYYMWFVYNLVYKVSYATEYTGYASFSKNLLQLNGQSHLN